MSQALSSIDNSPTQELSEQFINFIYHETNAPRPTQKRLKINSSQYVGKNTASSSHCDIDHIVVNQSVLEFKCTTSRLADTVLPLKRCNINPHIHWGNSLEPQYIHIRNHRRQSIFQIPLPSKEDRSDIFTALLVEKYSCKSTGACGRLWTEFDIGLVREDNFDKVELTLKIKWNITSTPYEIMRTENRSIALTEVLNTFFPDPRIVTREKWTPQDFYTAAHCPMEDEFSLDTLTIPQINCSLYPFQKKTVQWLLRREGVEWSHEGIIREYISTADSTGLESFLPASDFMGRKCFVSHLFGIVTLDINPFLTSKQIVKGGILSEEMGLGKTVEMISLISLHKRPTSLSDQVYDCFTGSYVRTTSATLIITPPSILHQWITEIRSHASSLKVLHYEGIKHYQNTDFLQLLDLLAGSDIVVTSYSILASEIHFTQLNPEKELRREPKYQRPKSPIMMLYWWRCMIDEAQIIESGVSNAAVLARMIPRVNAWCISGIPVKKDVNDLLGLLVFLRYEPFASSKHVWKALIASFKPELTNLIEKLAIRHSKQSVRNELNLPIQRRYVMMIPFAPVEEQNYQDLFKEMCDETCLDNQGRPVVKYWKAEQYSEIMRKWLARLRQTALHPQIGSKNRRALGQNEGLIRTIDQVINVMIEQTEASIRTDQRAMCLVKLKRGQYFENSNRLDKSLPIWLEAVDDAEIIVQECREDLNNEISRKKTEQESVGSEFHDSFKNNPELGGEQEDFDPTSRVGTLRNRLRGALEVEHIAKFFLAGAYFQLKSNVELTNILSLNFQYLEKFETDGYESAKKLRREILHEITSKADKLMKKVAEKSNSRSFIEIPEFSSDVLKEDSERQHIHQKSVEIAKSLNNQAVMLNEWRETLIHILLRPLIDEDEGLEITGNEYEDSTKDQDEVMVYVQAIRTLICDRHNVLTGQKNNLIRDEVKKSIRMALNGEGIYPEKTLELLRIREKLHPGNTNSVRGIINELRSTYNSLKMEVTNGNSRVQQQILIIEKRLKYFQIQLSEQLKVTVALEKEMEFFTSVMNTRLEYYRQLQQISDMVAPYDGPCDEKTLSKMLNEERALLNKIAKSKSKKRYLSHLQEEAANPKDQRTCVVCKDKFKVGTLTVCGHQYCRECISLWWSSHHNCPVCKRQLIQADLHKITCYPQQLSIKLDDTQLQYTRKNTPISSNSASSTIYSEMSQSKFAEIKNIDLGGLTFTTKIATLARHLIWLRDSDPGAKTIIFSQYKEFLHLLAEALEQLMIGYSSIDRPSGIDKFKFDPSIECFLLHARAHSSGLNLINANHVILCEPLINTELELQAIARVDRIGQHQETYVWLYIINGTVEESIHQLSIKRRIEHLDQDLLRLRSQKIDVDIEKNLEEVNSIQLRQASFAKLLAKGEMSGEMVASRDLWECLFGCRKVDTT